MRLFYCRNRVDFACDSPGSAFCHYIYLFYYRAIAAIGASKAMALNVSYAAWSILFTVLSLRDTSVLTVSIILCGVVVIVCNIFAAADFKDLFLKTGDVALSFCI